MRRRNMKQLYDTMKELSGKYNKTVRPVKDKENKPITEIQEQMNRWVKQFEEPNKTVLLNPPNIETTHEDLPVDVTPPTIEEIRIVIRQTKSVEAAGSDNMLAEALKSYVEVTS
ncbi:unnamed protein product, partial [Schistosoma mattheei]